MRLSLDTKKRVYAYCTMVPIKFFDCPLRKLEMNQPEVGKDMAKVKAILDNEDEMKRRVEHANFSK